MSQPDSEVPVVTSFITIPELGRVNAVSCGCWYATACWAAARPLRKFWWPQERDWFIFLHDDGQPLDKRPIPDGPAVGPKRLPIASSCA